jgi:hypothetical protein
MNAGITRIATIAVFVLSIIVVMMTWKERIHQTNDVIRNYSDMVCGFVSLYDVAAGSIAYGAVILACRFGRWVRYGFSAPESYTIKNILEIRHRYFIVSFVIVLSVMCILSVCLKLIDSTRILEKLHGMLSFL